MNNILIKYFFSIKSVFKNKKWGQVLHWINHLIVQFTIDAKLLPWQELDISDMKNIVWLLRKLQSLNLMSTICLF